MKTHGIPESWNGDDRGHVAIKLNFWVTEGINLSVKHNIPHVIWVITSILLNPFQGSECL